jgi:hypothetical protein
VVVHAFNPGTLEAHPGLQNKCKASLGYRKKYFFMSQKKKKKKKNDGAECVGRCGFLILFTEGSRESKNNSPPNNFVSDIFNGASLHFISSHRFSLLPVYLFKKFQISFIGSHWWGYALLNTEVQGTSESCSYQHKECASFPGNTSENGS